MDYKVRAVTETTARRMRECIMVRRRRWSTWCLVKTRLNHRSADTTNLPRKRHRCRLTKVFARALSAR